MKTIHEIEKEYDNLGYTSRCKQSDIDERKIEIINLLLKPFKEKIKQFYRSKMIELIEGVKEIVPEEKPDDIEEYVWTEAEIRGFNRCRSKVLTNLNNLLDNIKK